MADDPLRDAKVLIVEDEYLLAEELRTELMDAGAVVLGPALDTEAAMQLIRSARLDAALLDVKLRGELSFALADALAERGVPFVFMTGFDDGVIPPRFRVMERLQKPFRFQQLAEALAAAIRSARKVGS